ncbi:MAG: DNA polymerase IV [Oscillospiraceae bacterium]|nr:DNA polymerase IV [Oscillospiraceae bacterium]
MDRAILHCDCNSFFASVEMMLDPSLRGKPVAVAGDPKDRHGVVVAASAEAKRFGVRTTDTVYAALRKCPSLVVVPPHHDRYEQVSDAINEIYLQYTDLVDPFSVDESFLDVTHSPYYDGGSLAPLADELRRRVREEIGVTISVGGSFNRCFAKLASEMKKPDGTTVLPREAMEAVIWKLPARDMLYVGKSTAERLQGMGINTIGDIARADREALVAAMGRHGASLWDNANGLDNEPVRSYYAPREVKSIGNSYTFRRDLVTTEEIRTGIAALADSVAARLRAKGLVAYTVQLQIKNPQLKTIQRQRTLERPTHLMREITDICMELLRQHWPIGSPIRLLSVTCSDLVPQQEAGEQISLFAGEADARREKQEKLEAAMAAIREKHGRGSIAFGMRPEDEEDIGKKHLKD